MNSESLSSICFSYTAVFSVYSLSAIVSVQLLIVKDRTRPWYIIYGHADGPSKSLFDLEHGWIELSGLLLPRAQLLMLSSSLDSDSPHMNRSDCTPCSSKLTQPFEMVSRQQRPQSCCAGTTRALPIATTSCCSRDNGHVWMILACAQPGEPSLAHLREPI